MNLQEFIDKQFAGNISNFAKAYGITRQTVYNILSGATFPQTKLRESLKRKGVRFEKKEAVMKNLIVLWNGQIIEKNGNALRLFENWSDYCKNRGDRHYDRGSLLSALVNSSNILKRELGSAAMFFSKPTETRRNELEIVIKKRICNEIKYLVPEEELRPVFEKMEQDILKK